MNYRKEELKHKIEWLRKEENRLWEERIQLEKELQTIEEQEAKRPSKKQSQDVASIVFKNTMRKGKELGVKLPWSINMLLRNLLYNGAPYIIVKSQYIKPFEANNFKIEKLKVNYKVSLNN